METEQNKSILREIFDFLMERKAWWMLPIIIALSITAMLIILLQSSYISPFIYAL
jgi:hypothetical protein